MLSLISQHTDLNKLQYIKFNTIITSIWFKENTVDQAYIKKNQ